MSPEPEELHVGRPNIGDRATFLNYVTELFDRRWLTNDGPLVQRFEREVSQHLGVKHCVAMTNGTVALEIAIRALGMKGEVIVPSYTFVATAHALSWQGLTPVFADIDPVTHQLDPESVRQKLTPATTGIIGVHLWGRSSPVEHLQEIADQARIPLMFDAAHAFGVSHQGKMIGGFGRAEVFSFHATKFFNTFEGGAVTTNDDELAHSLRLMRNFGFAGEDNVLLSGTNGKMSEICAAMGLTNLDSLELFVEQNRINYNLYNALLSSVPHIRVLPVDEAEPHNNFQYIVIQLDQDCPVDRDVVLSALRAEKVLARRYFWPGIHRMAAYRMDDDPPASLPVTDAVANSVIVLPTGTSISEDQILRVRDILLQSVTCRN